MFSEFEAWLRYHASEEDRQKFKDMSRPQKAEFRALWAKSKLKVEEEKFQASRSLTQTQSQRGRWLSVRKIAWEYGNDPAAAIQYCKSCVQLGPSEYRMDVRIDLRW